MFKVRDTEPRWHIVHACSLGFYGNVLILCLFWYLMHKHKWNASNRQRIAFVSYKSWKWNKHSVEHTYSKKLLLIWYEHVRVKIIYQAGTLQKIIQQTIRVQNCYWISTEDQNRHNVAVCVGSWTRNKTLHQATWEF